MKFVVDIPDKYVYRWMKLSQEIGFDSFDNFIIHSLGIGIQTLDAAMQATQPTADNVVKFKPKYYWDDKEIKK